MSEDEPPMGPVRLFSSVLTVVDQSGTMLRAVPSAHVPEMGITVSDGLKKDTGGERQV